MSEEQSGEKRRLSIWLIIAIFFTLAYAAFIILAVDGSRTCLEEGLIAGIFGCLTMNELGDFLAGAFAPLAFVWLVAAVLIQSEELAAQREELSETRKEFVASRAVMKEQAEESRRQSEYIGEQTKILKLEQEERNVKKLKKEFDDRISNLATTMKFAPNSLSMRQGDRVKHCTVLRRAIKNNYSEEDLISAVSDAYPAYIAAVKVWREALPLDSTETFQLVQPYQFKSLLFACAAACHSMDKLPEAEQIGAHKFQLEHFMEGLSWVAEVAGNIEAQDLVAFRQRLD